MTLLMSIAMFGVFNEGGERATDKNHMLEELRKDHNNSRYAITEGMKMVEIGFANEI